MLERLVPWRSKPGHIRPIILQKLVEIRQPRPQCPCEPFQSREHDLLVDVQPDEHRRETVSVAGHDFNLIRPQNRAASLDVGLQVSYEILRHLTWTQGTPAPGGQTVIHQIGMLRRDDRRRRFRHEEASNMLPALVDVLWAILYEAGILPGGSLVQIVGVDRPDEAAFTLVARREREISGDKDRIG